MRLAPLLHCAASLEMPVGAPGIPVVSFSRVYLLRVAYSGVCESFMPYVSTGC